MPATAAPSAEQALTRMVSLLLKIPPTDRVRFARKQLTDLHPNLVQLFDAIPRDQLAKSVLFLVLNPHSRETRFAEAARIAGWHPLLVHLDKPKYAVDRFFPRAAKVNNIVELVLASWLFPGALVHTFVLGGDHAHLLALTKTHPFALDLYDTASGMNFIPLQRHRDERATLQLADGLTHRDLRIKYLQKIHGYALPAHNVLIHDPLPAIPPTVASPRNDGEIRVVSVGWVGAGDSSILRVARALCAAHVHLHVYFNPFQNGSIEAEAYRELQAESPYLHIESPVYGEEYWAHLTRYDFGLSIFEPFIFGERPRDYTADYLRGCGSSRLSDYIAANLGVIVTPGLRFQHFWARRHARATVEATADFLKNPRPALETACDQTARNRASAKIVATSTALAARLGSFYSSICESRSVSS